MICPSVPGLEALTNASAQSSFRGQRNGTKVVRPVIVSYLLAV